MSVVKRGGKRGFAFRTMRTKRRSVRSRSVEGTDGGAAAAEAALRAALPHASAKGWLKKHPGKKYRGWKVRWFDLRNGELSYRTHVTDKAPIKRIGMDIITEVSKVDGVPAGLKDEHAHCAFKVAYGVVEQKERNIVLLAASSRDRDIWVQRLQAAKRIYELGIELLDVDDETLDDAMRKRSLVARQQEQARADARMAAALRPSDSDSDDDGGGAGKPAVRSRAESVAPETIAVATTPSSPSVLGSPLGAYGALQRGDDDGEYTSSDDDDDDETYTEAVSREAKARAVEEEAAAVVGRESAWEIPPESPLGLVTRAPGWTIEPVDERVWGDKTSFNVLVEDADEHVGWYREHFAEAEHTNYVGVDKTHGPMAVSLVWQEDATVLRAIVWTRNGNSRLVFPALGAGERPPSAKSQLKTVLGAVRPEYASAAKKMVVAGSARDANELVKLEDSYLPRKYKFGLVYVREGQRTEAEFLANDCEVDEDGPDAAFAKFCNLIGTRVPLRGWDGYRAGLDVDNGGTGEDSVFADVRGYDVMFHVSTSLPHDRENSGQEVQRKRQIGNDIVAVVFTDGRTPYDPGAIHCQFLHCYAVVQPGPRDGQYLVQFVRQDCVRPFGPPTPSTIWDGDEAFVDFLLTKLVNAERVALRSGTTFVDKFKRTQEITLEGLYERAAGRTSKKRGGAVGPLGLAPRVGDGVLGSGPRAAIRRTEHNREGFSVSRFRTLGGRVTAFDVWGSTALYSITGEYLYIEDIKSAEGEKPAVMARTEMAQISAIAPLGIVVTQVARSGVLVVFYVSAIGPWQPLEVKGSKGTSMHAFGSTQMGEYMVAGIGSSLAIFEWVESSFHKVKRVDLPSAPHTLAYLKHGDWGVGHDKGFWLLSAGPNGSFSVTKLLKFKSVKPRAEARDIISLGRGELLCSYDQYSRFIARASAQRSRTYDLEWSGMVVSTVHRAPYVMAVLAGARAGFIEVRAVESGLLWAVVNLDTAGVGPRPQMRLVSTKVGVLVGVCGDNATVLWDVLQQTQDFGVRDPGPDDDGADDADDGPDDSPDDDDTPDPAAPAPPAKGKSKKRKDKSKRKAKSKRKRKQTARTMGRQGFQTLARAPGIDLGNLAEYEEHDDPDADVATAAADADAAAASSSSGATLPPPVPGRAPPPKPQPPAVPTRAPPPPRPAAPDNGSTPPIPPTAPPPIASVAFDSSYSSDDDD